MLGRHSGRAQLGSEGLTALGPAQVVMLELCNGRSGLLRAQAKAEVPSLSKMIEEYKSGKTPLMGVVYSWLLARIGENMEVLRPSLGIRSSGVTLHPSLRRCAVSTMHWTTPPRPSRAPPPCCLRS